VTIVGAGFGGLYGAFRLQNDSSSGYLPSDVSLFESSDRVGGRAYTLKDVFPTLNKPSLGAHRWDPDVHIIVDSVIEKVLGLNTRCYFHDTPCVDSGGFYSFLRNSYTGDLSKSPNVYHLNKDERWNKKQGPSDVVGEMKAYYPNINWDDPDLVSADPSIRYPAIKNAIDALRFSSVDGALPSQLTIRTILNHSSEFWELIISAWGEAYYILDVLVYTSLRDDLLNGYSNGKSMIVLIFFYFIHPPYTLSFLHTPFAFLPFTICLSLYQFPSYP
jgi:hypothetical protein